MVVVEDRTPADSHDIRLTTRDPLIPGLYRLSFAVRKRERTHIAVQVTRSWNENILLSIDLETLTASAPTVKGELFQIVHGPELAMTDQEWVLGAAVIRLNDVVLEDAFLVLYIADDSGNIYYDGSGQKGLELAVLDLSRIDLLRTLTVAVMRLDDQ